jgi:RimJ/RimL family protein N-acetyltransferase
MQTERLILRSLKRADLPAIQRLVNDRAISRNFSNFPYPFTGRDAKSFFDFVQTGQKRKTMAAFVMVRRSDDQILGMTRLDSIDRVNKNAELFFWVGTEYQGRGYASEAVKCVLRYAFATLKLRIVVKTWIQTRRSPASRNQKRQAVD